MKQNTFVLKTLLKARSGEKLFKSNHHCDYSCFTHIISGDRSVAYRHHLGSCTYLIFVIFFTRAKFLENKIYTEKTRKLRQNIQKIANFMRYYGKIHNKLPIFRVKSVIYTGQKKFTRAPPMAPVTNMKYAAELLH